MANKQTRSGACLQQLQQQTRFISSRLIKKVFECLGYQLSCQVSYWIRYWVWDQVSNVGAIHDEGDCAARACRLVYDQAKEDSGEQ